MRKRRRKRRKRRWEGVRKCKCTAIVTIIVKRQCLCGAHCMAGILLSTWNVLVYLTFATVFRYRHSHLHVTNWTTGATTSLKDSPKVIAGMRESQDLSAGNRGPKSVFSTASFWCLLRVQIMTRAVVARLVSLLSFHTTVLRSGFHLPGLHGVLLGGRSTVYQQHSRNGSRRRKDKSQNILHMPK